MALPSPSLVLAPSHIDHNTPNTDSSTASLRDFAAAASSAQLAAALALPFAPPRSSRSSSVVSLPRSSSSPSSPAAKPHDSPQCISPSGSLLSCPSISDSPGEPTARASHFPSINTQDLTSSPPGSPSSCLAPAASSPSFHSAASNSSISLLNASSISRSNSSASRIPTRSLTSLSSSSAPQHNTTSSSWRSSLLLNVEPHPMYKSNSATGPEVSQKDVHVYFRPTRKRTTSSSNYTNDTLNMTSETDEQDSQNNHYHINNSHNSTANHSVSGSFVSMHEEDAVDILEKIIKDSSRRRQPQLQHHHQHSHIPSFSFSSASAHIPSFSFSTAANSDTITKKSFRKHGRHLSLDDRKSSLQHHRKSTPPDMKDSTSTAPAARLQQRRSAEYQKNPIDDFATIRVSDYSFTSPSNRNDSYNSHSSYNSSSHTSQIPPQWTQMFDPDSTMTTVKTPYDAPDDDVADPYSSPMYLALSSPNASPFLKQAWLEAKIILIPPNRSLPDEAFDLIEREYPPYDPSSLDDSILNTLERFFSLHTLVPHPLHEDRLIGIGLTPDGNHIQVQLNVDQRLVEISNENANPLENSSKSSNNNSRNVNTPPPHNAPVVSTPPRNKRQSLSLADPPSTSTPPLPKSSSIDADNYLGKSTIQFPSASTPSSSASTEAVENELVNNTTIANHNNHNNIISYTQPLQSSSTLPSVSSSTSTSSSPKTNINTASPRSESGTLRRRFPSSKSPKLAYKPSVLLDQQQQQIQSVSSSSSPSVFPTNSSPLQSSHFIDGGAPSPTRTRPESPSSPMRVSSLRYRRESSCSSPLRSTGNDNANSKKASGSPVTTYSLSHQQQQQQQPSASTITRTLKIIEEMTAYRKIQPSFSSPSSPVMPHTPASLATSLSSPPTATTTATQTSSMFPTPTSADQTKSQHSQGSPAKSTNTKSSKPKKDRIKFKAPKWLRFKGKEKEKGNGNGKDVKDGQLSKDPSDDASQSQQSMQKDDHNPFNQPSVASPLSSSHLHPSSGQPRQRLYSGTSSMLTNATKSKLERIRVICVDKPVIDWGEFVSSSHSGYFSTESTCQLFFTSSPPTSAVIPPPDDTMAGINDETMICNYDDDDDYRVENNDDDDEADDDGLSTRAVAQHKSPLLSITSPPQKGTPLSPDRDDSDSLQPMSSTPKKNSPISAAVLAENRPSPSASKIKTTSSSSTNSPITRTATSSPGIQRTLSLKEGKNNLRLSISTATPASSLSSSQSQSNHHFSHLQNRPRASTTAAPLSRSQLQSTTSQGQNNPRPNRQSRGFPFPYIPPPVWVNVVPHSREVLSDVSFLLSPPTPLQNLSSHFQNTLRYIAQLSCDFSTSFTFTIGYEHYTSSRIRHFILDKVWVDMAPIIENDNSGHILLEHERGRLFALLENVVMAFLYNSVYVKALIPLFEESDRELSDLLLIYTEHGIEPFDFGVGDVLSSIALNDFESALSTMINLFEPGQLQKLPEPQQNIFLELMQPFEGSSLFPYNNSHLNSNNSGGSYSYDNSGDRPPPSPTTTFHLSTWLILLLNARTPQQIIAKVRGALDDIVKAVKKHDSSSMSLVGTDHLIPMLAYLIARALPTHLESMKYFAMSFRLSESMAADLDWAMSTFQAAVKFLKSDPLSLRGDALSISKNNHQSLKLDLKSSHYGFDPSHPVPSPTSPLTLLTMESLKQSSTVEHMNTSQSSTSTGNSYYLQRTPSQDLLSSPKLTTSPTVNSSLPVHLSTRARSSTTVDHSNARHRQVRHRASRSTSVVNELGKLTSSYGLSSSSSLSQESSGNMNERYRQRYKSAYGTSSVTTSGTSDTWSSMFAGWRSSFMATSSTASASQRQMQAPVSSDDSTSTSSNSDDDDDEYEENDGDEDKNTEDEDEEDDLTEQHNRSGESWWEWGRKRLSSFVTTPQAVSTPNTTVTLHATPISAITNNAANVSPSIDTTPKTVSAERSKPIHSEHLIQESLYKNIYNNAQLRARKNSDTAANVLLSRNITPVDDVLIDDGDDDDNTASTNLNTSATASLQAESPMRGPKPLGFTLDRSSLETLKLAKEKKEQHLRQREAPQSLLHENNIRRPVISPAANNALPPRLDKSPALSSRSGSLRSSSSRNFVPRHRSHKSMGNAYSSSTTFNSRRSLHDSITMPSL